MRFGPAPLVQQWLQNLWCTAVSIKIFLSIEPPLEVNLLYAVPSPPLLSELDVAILTDTLVRAKGRRERSYSYTKKAPLLITPDRGS